MKNILKTSIKILVFCFALTLVNCEKDDEIVSNNNELKQKSLFQFKIKSFNELNEDDKFKKAYNKTLKVSAKNNVLKTGMEENYGFDIDSSSINELVSSNKTSYTMLIHREEPNATFFENLVVEIDSLYQIEANIVKYTYNTSVQPIYSETHSAFSLGVSVEITPIIYDASVAKVTCTNMYVGYCSQGGTNHVAGDNCTEIYGGSWFSFCSGGDSGAGGQTGGNNNNGQPGDGTTQEGNSTPNGGVDFNNPPIYTAPVTPTVQGQLANQLNESLSDLIGEFGIWFGKDLSEEITIKLKAVVTYLLNGGDPGFAKEAIKVANGDDEVDFDENIIYDSSLADFPCHKLVIQDAIGTCSPLTQLVLDIFEANDNSNLILKVANNLGANANTSAVSVYDPLTHTCNTTIQFDQTYIENATDLSIARTAIHESLHAILAYMAEDGLLVNPNGQSFAGFEQLVQAYIDYQSGLPQYFGMAHHELMADFVEDMALSLSNYAVANGYNTQNSNGLGFEFYKKLCWAGLTTTEEFLEIYPKYINPNDAVNNSNNYNPEWLDIKLTIQAEIYNQQQTFIHPNGNIYDFIQKGTPANEQEPCSN